MRGLPDTNSEVEEGAGALTPSMRHQQPSNHNAGKSSHLDTPNEYGSYTG